MTEPADPADLATAVLRGQAWSAAPSVARLRTDVRSGENFLITNGGSLPALFIGAVVAEWGYEVARDQADAFHAWLQANEQAVAAECPAGVRYCGTYAVFAQSENALGAYRTVWAFDSLASMEAMAAERAAGGSFGRRLAELTGFRDERIGAARSQQIYHPAATAIRT